jgi:hypothetical protein
LDLVDDRVITALVVDVPEPVGRSFFLCTIESLNLFVAESRILR